VTGAQMRSLRERLGLSRGQLIEALNASLDRRYDSTSISRWERGIHKVPAAVEGFLDELALQSGLEALGAPLSDEPAPATDPPDSMPGEPLGPDSVPGGGFEAQAPMQLRGSPLLVTACTEMWEMIATGLGTVGALIGSEGLILDGQIVNADKAALGEAWGRLAETNETLRRMLNSAVEGGVWLQVALVTGSTFSKCYQGHVELGQRRRMMQAQQNVDATDAQPVAA
jgi:transcriptional regulator with XRE-family HTH domain